MDQVLDPVHGSQVANDAGVDGYFMDRALALAWRAAGRTHPNPLVGAVVVRDGRVVGEGFHATCGQPHAEIIALDQAGDAAKGATLYSTLEPCSHHGRTPPCVDAIVASGVTRLVAATRDPDARVDGKGFEILRKNGIEVELGCRAEAAIALNLPYFKRQLSLGPAVTLKMATTLDGRIATMPNRRDAVTGHEAQKFVHALRATHAAVAVGADTVVTDRPRLDCRVLDEVREPVPVVFDSNQRVPRSNTWESEGREYVVATMSKDDDVSGVRRAIACAGRDGRVCVAAATERLREAGFDSVLVEGGAQLFASYVDAKIWDVMHIIVAPKLFGAGGVPLVNVGMDGGLDAVPVDASRLKDDYRVTYFRGEALRPLLDRLAR